MSIETTDDFQKVWIVLGLGLVCFLLYSLQPILMPFLIGSLLAYLGDPLADKLEAKKLSRTQSICIVFFLLTLVLVIVVLLTFPMIGHQINVLASKIPLWIDLAQKELIPFVQKNLGLPENSLPLGNIKSAVTENWEGAGEVLRGILGQVAGSSMALLALVANLLLIPVVTFYLLRDWDVLVGHIRDLLPRSMEDRVVSLVTECDEIIGAFIRGQLLVMLALTIIYSIGLWIVGLDLALLLGVVAGLASIVPYMGFIVGITAACIAAFFQFHELVPLIAVAAVFGVGQLLEGMVLTPILVGDRIGLHPVAVIFSIMAGGQLAGFTGILLALPVAAVIMVFLRHMHRNYKESELYKSVSDEG